MNDDLNLNQSLDDLSEEQRRLLSRLLNEEGIELAEAIASQNTGRIEAPLSYTQERLWVTGELIAPGTAFGNVPIAFRVTGPLDTVILHKSVNDIVRRHYVLRTTYPVAAGKRIQRVSEHSNVPCRTEDVSDLPEAERVGQAMDLVIEESNQPFDFEEDLALRVLVVKLDEQDHLLLLVTHHFATDGWGIRVLMRELMRSYGAIRSGAPHTPDEIPFQYTDFSVWQRERVRTGDLDDQLDYWEEKLTGCPKVLQFPNVDPTVENSAHCTLLPVHLSRELSTRLREKSRAEGVTLFMTLMSAFQAVLHGYTGEHDVVMGTIISNRTRREVEQLIGNCGNNVFCRLNFGELRTFRDIIRATREEVLAAQRHQDVPLEVLIDKSFVSRRENPVPRFQVMFLLRDSRLNENLEIPGLSFEQLPVTIDLMPLDFNLDLTDSDDGITGFLAYKTDLIEEPVAKQLLDALEATLEKIASDPDQEVDPIWGVESDHLTQQQRAAPVQERLAQEDWFWQPVWKRISSEDPSGIVPSGNWLVFIDDCGLGSELVRRLELSENQVVTVHSVAVSSGYTGESFRKVGESSYEMNPELGRPGYEALLAELVSIGMVPDYIAHLWLVTEREEYRPGSNFFHRNLEHGYYSLGHLARSLHHARIETPVQIISMSTGIYRIFDEPVEYPEKAAALGPLRVIPQQFPNMSCKHIDLGPLNFKGQGKGAFPQNWLGVLDSVESIISRATHNSSVAYRDGELWEMGFEPCPTSLITEHLGAVVRDDNTYLITGGLGGAGQIAARTLSQCARVNLVILDRTTLPDDRDAWLADHGPEDAVSRAIALVRELEDLGSRVLVVSADVADPSAVAQALSEAANHFGPLNGVIHAASNTSPERSQIEETVDAAFSAGVYGTLALASALANTELDFWITLLNNDAVVDRVDASAVKAFANSFALGSIPMVAVNWGPWSDTLNDGMSNDEASAALARALTTTVPRQLWISPFQPGEGDWQESSDGVTGTRPQIPYFVAPRDEIETTLVNLWSAALGVENIGIRDNFFHLGGHSLIAVRLLEQIATEFSLEWPLSVMFSAPTIEEFAQLVRRERTGVDECVSDKHVVDYEFLVPIVSRPDDENVPFFVAAGGYGNVLNLQHLAQICGADRPFYALQSRGLVGGTSPHETFESMANDFLREIREVQPHGPYLLGGYCTGGIAAFEMAQQLVEAGEEVPLVVLFDAPCPNHEESITFQDKLRIHCQGFRERGMRYFLNWLKARINWKLKRFASVPNNEAAIRAERIFGAAQTAMQQYNPKDYAGNTILYRPVLEKRYILGPRRFLNSERDFVYEDNGWGSYARNLDIYEVPGKAGDHDEFILEPKVRNIAMSLNNCLKNAIT